jgi:hypothetical protein
MVISVKPGDFSSIRKPKRKSCHKLCMISPQKTVFSFQFSVPPI